MKKRRRKSYKKYFFIFLIAVIALLFYFDFFEIQKKAENFLENQNSEMEAFTTAPLEKEEEVFVKLPPFLEVPFCPEKNHAFDHELRKFSYYSLCYRESYEQAEWSAYCLSDYQLEKNADRSNDFRSDPMISTGSAQLSDYRKSGFDRGHLTPAADMSFSGEAMSETFFMSNMSPQAPAFNRGIWKDLEAQVRLWVQKFGRVWIVSGPILNKDAAEYQSIGENQVAVPEYFYKVILVPLYEDQADRQSPDDAKAAIALGFVIPNQKCEDSFWNYARSIDEIEKLTGLDFYSLLPDENENQIEKSFCLEDWK